MDQIRETVSELLSSDAFVNSKKVLLDTTEVIKSISEKYKIVLIGTGAVVGLYWYLTRTHGYFKKIGVPGPKPGFFGALSDYKKMGIRTFDRAMVQKYGKVVGIYHSTVPVYLIADPEMIKQITVKEFANFVNRDRHGFPRDPILKDSVVSAYDDIWRFHRSTLSPTFTSGKMRTMCPLVQKCVDNLLKSLWKTSEEGRKSMKMRDVFSMFAMDVVASIAFGVDLDCQSDPDNAFLRNSKRVLKPGLKLWAVFTLCSLFPFLTKFLEAMGIGLLDSQSSKFFHKLAIDAVKHRRETNEERNDFLQLLLNAQNLEAEAETGGSSVVDQKNKRGLTDNEIVGNCMIFLIAGFESVSLSLSFIAYNLATNPVCQEKLIAEIDQILDRRKPDYDNVSRLTYLENVFFESLRLFPPAFRIIRCPKEDIEINGIQIKKNTDVSFPVGAIHYDPDIWSDPETFDPDRFLPENRPENFNYVFLPFGVGPRNCIGMRLAHMEVKIATAAILQKYRFKTAPETKIPPDLEKRAYKPNDGMVLMIEKR